MRYQNKTQGSIVVIIVLIIVLACIASVLIIRSKDNSLPTQTHATSTVITQTSDLVPSSSPENIQTSTHVKPKEYKQKDSTNEIVWPVVYNLGNSDIEKKINKALSISQVTGIEEYVDLHDINDFSESDYRITYDKNDILSLVIWIESMGAYPIISNYYLVFDLKTGNRITLSDIIKKDKMDAFMQLLNTRLSQSISEAIEFAKKDNPQNDEDRCTASVIEEEIASNKEYMTTYGTFDRNHIDISISSSGIDVIYPFGFRHAVRACEPEQLKTLTPEELKPFLSRDLFTPTN